MTHHLETTIDRNVTEGLAALGRVTAPAGFPARVMAALRDRWAVISTELGDLDVAFSATGITAVRGAWETPGFADWYRGTYGKELERVDELPAAVRGKYDLSGTGEFQQLVLRKALEIPRGQVRPYNWIAAEIGRPGAVRAVGTALATNPIPYFIPCHRVVRSDGKIGNYGLGGTEFKRRILRAEGADPDDLERHARRGVRFTGSDTTRIFCFPTCSHARRVTDKHRVWFKSEADAQGHGYRPCKVCRPTAQAAA